MADNVHDRLKSLMMRHGTVIIFGPQYLEATMALVQSDEMRAVFSCARIDDLAIPDILTIGCVMVFNHTVPSRQGPGVTRPELERWSAALLAGIVFRPDQVPGLDADDIDEPALELVADDKTNEATLSIIWGPVPSRHCLEVARALEGAYARNGGTW